MWRIACHDLNHLVADLQRHGARNIRADLMPVNDGTDYARVMISYASVSAAAPKDCPHDFVIRLVVLLIVK